MGRYGGLPGCIVRRERRLHPSLGMAGYKTPLRALLAKKAAKSGPRTAPGWWRSWLVAGIISAHRRQGVEWPGS